MGLWHTHWAHMSFRFSSIEAEFNGCVAYTCLFENGITDQSLPTKKKHMTTFYFSATNRGMGISAFACICNLYASFAQAWTYSCMLVGAWKSKYRGFSSNYCFLWEKHVLDPHKCIILLFYHEFIIKHCHRLLLLDF